MAPQAMLFYLPGVAAAVACLYFAITKRERRLPGALGAVASLAALLAPAVCMWWVWEIVGDHTANIGAGLLLFAEPVLAPSAAGLGWRIGTLLRALLSGDRLGPASGDPGQDQED